LSSLVPAALSPKFKSKEIQRGEFFVKKAFCLVTSGFPSSRELNRINIFLRKVCTSPRMFGRFEEYLARLLFEIPLPMRMYAVTL